ncbi:hypothetical protein KEJ49_02325 [Candidatus Bathyarchaeota archaeon]|nr:hypothetical protein [Candidatus Bathyarchaeota archaeon]
MAEIDEAQEAYSIGRYRDRVVSGPIFRTLLWLGAPLLLSHLIFVAYHVLDAYWLSLYGEVTVAVPRQVWPVIMLFQALLNALTAACMSIVSQYIGSKNFREASLSASRFFTVAFITGAAQCILLLSLREYIFTWVISTPPEIFEDIMKYSAVESLDVFFNCISFTYLTLLQRLWGHKEAGIDKRHSGGSEHPPRPLPGAGNRPLPQAGGDRGLSDRRDR